MTIVASHRPRRILLVATMRNEGPYIPEWLAYHRAIGFTDILVCSNDCVDESPALLDRLEQLGLLVHLRSTPASPREAQLVAYTLAAAHPLTDGADWAMVLDADEYLNVHVGAGQVGDLIDAVPGATAICVNWRLFGSSGHRRWSPDLVSERFTRAAPLEHGVNWPYKTLFTRLDAYGCKLLSHQPRFPHAHAVADLRYVDGAGRILPEHFYDESRSAFLQSDPGTVSWKLAQVNHYNTRSRDDYFAKHRRGGGIPVDWDRESCWPVFDRNEEEDLTIAPKLPAMKRELASMREDAELVRLHERCCVLYGAHIDVLKAEADTTAAPA